MRNEARYQVCRSGVEKASWLLGMMSMFCMAFRHAGAAYSGQACLSRTRLSARAWHERVMGTFFFSIDQAAVAFLVYSIAMTGQRRS